MSAQFKDWLLGVEGKPGPKSSEDKILDLWALGFSDRQIAERVKHANGQNYTIGGVVSAIVRAREAGDPRARLKRNRRR